MKYTATVDGWSADELLADTNFPVEVYNVSVGSSASLSRGDLICAGSMSGVFAPVSSASDAGKVLMIAADDFVADSLSTVTRAYAAGTFSREKITFGGASLTTEPFEQALRLQNIHLRGTQES